MLPPDIKAIICDMDGVLWRDEEPLGDLAAASRALAEKGIAAAFATNNSTSTPERYAARLASHGFAVDAKSIVTASMAVAALMRGNLGDGATVWAMGEEGLIQALVQAGLRATGDASDSAIRAVVLGLDRGVNFEKMRDATLLVRSGLPFYATNPDRTFPTPRGEIPGAGAWAAVVSTASGVTPTYAGKPNPHLFELARQRLGTAREATLVIGDRLETDAAGAQAAGLPCAIVLTGVATEAEARAWTPKLDFISQSLWTLLEA